MSFPRDRGSWGNPVSGERTNVGRYSQTGGERSREEGSGAGLSQTSAFRPIGTSMGNGTGILLTSGKHKWFEAGKHGGRRGGRMGRDTQPGWVFLGRILRVRRGDLSLSVREMANRLHGNSEMIAQIESGLRGIPEARVGDVAALYELDREGFASAWRLSEFVNATKGGSRPPTRARGSVSGGWNGVSRWRPPWGRALRWCGGDRATERVSQGCDRPWMRRDRWRGCSPPSR